MTVRSAVFSLLVTPLLAQGPAFIEPPVRSSANLLLDTTLEAKVSPVVIAGQTVLTGVYEGTFPGPTLRVKPGERVPMDGVVRSGQTSINQAPVTGESIPVDKTAGDAVFAGTINESGTFEVEVTALASASTLARIIHAVEAAQATRAPTQGFVDRFAAVYTPAIFVIALTAAGNFTVPAL